MFTNFHKEANKYFIKFGNEVMLSSRTKELFHIVKI